MSVLIVPEDPPRSKTGRTQDTRWEEFVSDLEPGTLPFHAQWTEYQRIFRNRPNGDGPPLAWTPSSSIIAAANLTPLQESVGARSYAELYEWSIRRLPDYIGHALDRLGVVFAKRPDALLDPGTDARHVTWFPEAEMNCVDSCFTAPPDKTAIIFAREGDSELITVSYGGLEQQVNRVATTLRTMGMAGKGVALYMPMTVECVVAYLAVIRAGGHVISIADSFAPAELKKRLALGRAAAIVTVERSRRGGKDMQLYAKVLEAESPPAIVVPAVGETAAPRRPNDMGWDQLFEHSDDGEWAHGAADATINVLFSSGTTGTPKMIPWTHATPVKTAMDGHFHQDIHSTDVLAWPTNIGWMMGPWLIFNAFVNAATMALFEGNPASPEFTNFIGKARVSMLGVIPSLVRTWRRLGIPDDDLWNSVRVLSSTGETSNREDYLWLMSRTRYRAPVIECLGGTEIGGGHLTGTVVQPASPATFTTPTLGTKVVLLNVSGQACQPGEQGEMFLVPPALGLSQRLIGGDHNQVYYKDTPIGPGGELLRRHGDQMAHLPNGFVRALGRADDTMNLSGIKISAREIEAVVDSHPAVLESAAIAVQPSGEGEDHLVVYAVLHEETASNDLTAALQELIARELNPLFRLHGLETIETLPRTASNKVKRRELRDRNQRSVLDELWRNTSRL